MTRLAEWQGGPSSLCRAGSTVTKGQVGADGAPKAESMRVSASGPSGQIDTGAVITVSAGSLWKEAAALSFMSAGPQDIRPDLLLYVVAQDSSRFPRLLAYGCNYLRHCLQLHDQAVPEVALHAAASDALMIMLTRVAPFSIRQRALTLQMRSAEFGLLRRRALNLFRSRYREATERYVQALVGVSSTLDPAD